MTTNVYDGIAGVIATDSRWSCPYGRYLVYTDETNCHKIELLGNFAFMFAGEGRKIQQWKDWIKSNPTSYDSTPEVNGITVSIVDIQEKKVVLSEGVPIVRTNSMFAGSGATLAVLCWDQNYDACKAVRTASILDNATGGDVKFVSAENNNLKNTNDSYPNTIEDVERKLKTEGYVMNTVTKETVKVSEFLESTNDDFADKNNLKTALLSGEIAAQAPCDSMYSEWTVDAKTRLKSALGGIFNWNKN